MVEVAVVGAAGYAGIEAVRWVLGHPRLHLALATSAADEGRAIGEVYPALAHATDLAFSAPDADAIAGQRQVALLAVPHTAALALAPALLERGVRVVDLSADYRLDADVYEEWYATPHTSPDLLGEAVYGLPELDRSRLADARLVACPGCYPTATVLAVLPALEAGVAIGTRVVVDAKSGVSGAGRAPSAGTHYCAVNESVAPYKVGVHRHTPEIERALRAAAGREISVIFAPHLVPMTRGLLSTVYVDVEDGLHRRGGGRALPRSLPRRAVRAACTRQARCLRPPRWPARTGPRSGCGWTTHQHTHGSVRYRQPGQGRGGPGDPVPQRDARLSRDRGPRRARGGGLDGAAAGFGYAEGGVVAAAGFSCAGVYAGLKRDGHKDVALVVAEGGAVPAAAVFTTNAVAAAPVEVSRRHIAAGVCRAVVINAGNANACTGPRGRDDAERMAAAVAEHWAPYPRKSWSVRPGSSACLCPSIWSWQASPRRSATLDSASGDDAAEAIMTTDTFAKQSAVTLEVEGRRYTVGGMAKGSGMIAPNMATMLGVITTDAPLTSAACDEALRRAVPTTFNRVTVDSDTSTNDTVVLMASGAAGGTPIAPEDASFVRSWRPFESSASSSRACSRATARARPSSSPLPWAGRQ